MKSILNQALNGKDLSEAQAEQALHTLAEGSVDPIQAGALLTALRAKGETAEEVRGFARAMRALALAPDLSGLPADTKQVDTCGTGGDGSGSLNLSTGAGLLAAAAGATVVKHGNRSISSKSGSADVLAALGVPMDAASVPSQLAAHRFAFLFAPHHHPAMKAIMPVRRALGVRTIFNILGPLCNPARPPFQVVGAYAPDVARLMAEALSGLDIERAFVVHGALGWDEATPVGPFLLLDVRDGTVTETMRDPAQMGISPCTPEDLSGGEADENARRLRAALQPTAAPTETAHREALVLGAALALEVTGLARNARQGVQQARAALSDGRAARLLSSIRPQQQAAK